jgi:hypothetical protein
MLRALRAAFLASDPRRLLPHLRKRWLKVTLFAGLLIGGFTAFAIAGKVDTAGLVPHNIEISSTNIEFDRSHPERHDFGPLIWRGGMELRSVSPYFGGYSGLTLSADGTRLLAVSDSGSWLSAKLNYDGKRITGLSEGRVGAITQKDGRPLANPRFRDAESLVAISPEMQPEMHVLIGFEARHRIDEYIFANGVMRGPVATHPLPANLKRMRSNTGLEAVGILRGGPYAGAVVAISEHLLTRQGDHTGAIVIAGQASPLYFARTEEFDITDVKGLNDGSLLVLERSFDRMSFHLETRIRHIPAHEIHPGARLLGEELLRAGPEMQIDNFEGLAVSNGTKGETIITLISDDNFSFLQRTLLMQFEMK